jgi:hypothetical protein
MIDPLKPVGGFIENTIRPMLDELHWFFDECDKKGININERNIKTIIHFVSRCHFNTVLLHLVQNVVLTLIVCATWIISQ